MFPASQCQDGDEVLTCYKYGWQVIKRVFREPKHTKEHIKKDSRRDAHPLETRLSSFKTRLVTLILLSNNLFSRGWNVTLLIKPY